MSIIYALIAKQDRYLAEYTTFSGNFTLTAQQIVKACSSDKKYTRYGAGNYIFYILNVECIFLVMCDYKYSERIAFNFLERIRKLFIERYSEEAIRHARMYGMMEFSKLLRENLQLYNKPEDVDKVAKLSKQTQEVSDIINEDLEKVIARGEKIQVLVKKTETMATLSLEMKTSARQVRNQMMWQNWKCRILIALGVALFIYILMVVICGGFGLGGCV